MSFIFDHLIHKTVTFFLTATSQSLKFFETHTKNKDGKLGLPGNDKVGEGPRHSSRRGRAGPLTSWAPWAGAGLEAVMLATVKWRISAHLSGCCELQEYKEGQGHLGCAL